MQFFRKWWFHIVGLGLMSAILVRGIMAKPVTSATDKDTYVRFYDGWSQLVDGEYIPLEDIHLFYVVLIYLLSCLQVFDLLFGRPILSHMIGGHLLCECNSVEAKRVKILYVLSC